MRIIDHIMCYIDSFKEDLIDKIWNNTPHKVECCICGGILRSKYCRYSPENCGWRQIKFKYCPMWICHQCLDHRDFTPFVEQADKNERIKWEMENEIMKWEIENR